MYVLVKDTIILVIVKRGWLLGNDCKCHASLTEAAGQGSADNFV